MPDLITYTDVHSITSLNTLVEERKLKPGIRAAHLELEKVLGRTGYALVYANAPSFAAQGADSAAYVTLLGYIKRFMAWRARTRSTVALWAEADRGGTFIKSGGDYEAVGTSGLKAVEADAESYTKVELDLLIQHLEQNVATFTWYTTNVEGEERIDKTNTKGAGGVSFRRAHGQNTYRG